MSKAKKKPVKAGTSKGAAAARKALFAEAYIANDGNATEAAKKAGYAARSAHTTGYRLLKDAEVQQYLDDRRAELRKKYELTTENVIRSIAQDLFFDPAKLYNEDGSLKRVVDLDEDTRMALQSVEMVQLGSEDAPIFIKKVKWSPRATAREQAMKHLGMFQKDNEQTKPELPAEAMPILDAARRIAFTLAQGAAAAKKGKA